MCKKVMSIMRRTKSGGRILALLLAGCMLTGCSSAVGEDEDLILVEKEVETMTYEMAVVSVGDVRKSEKTKCVYQQVNDESLSFGVSGKRIAKVYVKEGEDVVKGQILAELDLGNVEEQVRDLEYNIARNELNLSYIEPNMNNEISSLWLKFIYQSGQSDGERKALEENVKGVQQRYRYAQEDCEDALALDRAQLAQLQKSMKESVLRAGINGTISKIQERLEGSTSVKDEEIIKIIDSTECLFAVDDLSLRDCFSEGVEVDMSIAYGSGAGDYKLVPYDIGNWKDVFLFSISDGNQDAVIEVGTMGTMRYTTDYRTQVLTVPLRAVHQADGKSFVYVLGENQMREVKWIETGLFGDDKVEVISGLAEGEKVIVK